MTLTDYRARTVPHYYQQVEGGFWYRRAYERLLAGLPSDRASEWVEVGVFHGQSLAWLAVEVVNRDLPVTIHAVDTFEGWRGTLCGAALRAAFDRTMAPVRHALGDRLQVHEMPSVEAAASFPDHTLDVVWLDADHSYSSTRADILAWSPKLRAGGVLGGDDWDFGDGGVRRAVQEVYPCRYTLTPGERLGAPWPAWMVTV